MKRCGFFKFTILLLCFATLNIHGQRKEIPREEYLKAIQLAENKTRNISHRIKGESRTFRRNEKKPYQSAKWLYEFQSLNETRSVAETTSVQSGATEIIETIEVGRFQYKKINNGEWQATLVKAYNNLPVSSFWKDGEQEYYLAPDVKLNNQRANLYQYVIRTKIGVFQPLGGTSIKPFSVSHSEKRWISNDGLLLKIELVSDFSFNLSGDSVHDIKMYEYDPNIKVVAPIPEPQTNVTIKYALKP